METAQWPQQGLEKRVRPHKEKALNCPRCNSTNTKFCYYNNYSLSQPRYFCKSCRRYWTDGGSLRNVPIGGGSRKKNKTYFNSSSSSSSPQPPLTAASSASSWNLQPSKLSSFSLSPSVSALEPIRSGISSRRLISFELPNLSKKTELSANAGMKFPLECGVNGSLVEMKQGGDESELALPFEDLKQVRINGCDELALFWEGVMGNGEGGAW